MIVGRRESPSHLLNIRIIEMAQIGKRGVGQQRAYPVPSMVIPERIGGAVAGSMDVLHHVLVVAHLGIEFGQPHPDLCADGDVSQIAIVDIGDPYSTVVVRPTVPRGGPGHSESDPMTPVLDAGMASHACSGMRAKHTDQPRHAAAAQNEPGASEDAGGGVAFSGALPPEWAFALAHRINEHVNALTYQERLGALTDLSLDAPLVACVLAVGLRWREETPAPVTVFDWMRRTGRKTRSLALAQVLCHDRGLAQHVEDILHKGVARTIDPSSRSASGKPDCAAESFAMKLSEDF